MRFHDDSNEKQGKDISERYEFRDIRKEEAERAAEIERICFPPNEACSEEHMRERIEKAPELFLAAVDRQTGGMAGFRDEFFTDAGLHNPAGSNIMLLGLDVLPQHRGQGLAGELVAQYVRRERERGRKMLLLTCLQGKVNMYEKMGFTDRGIADSAWGKEEWHEMSRRIEA